MSQLTVLKRVAGKTTPLRTCGVWCWGRFASRDSAESVVSYAISTKCGADGELTSLVSRLSAGRWSLGETPAEHWPPPCNSSADELCPQSVRAATELTVQTVFWMRTASHHVHQTLKDCVISLILGLSKSSLKLQGKTTLTGQSYAALKPFWWQQTPASSDREPVCSLCRQSPDTEAALHSRRLERRGFLSSAHSSSSSSVFQASMQGQEKFPHFKVHSAACEELLPNLQLKVINLLT